jgi:hypothetical protein
MLKNSGKTRKRHLLGGTAKVLRALLRPHRPLIGTISDGPALHRRALLQKTRVGTTARPDLLTGSLDRNIEERETIIAGSLELIGLDDVRFALADAWSSIAERVRDVAEEELQRHLDPLDIFRRHGDAAYLIHFDSLDKLTAEHKAQSIARHLRTALAQKIPEVADAISVRHFVADVASEDLREGDLPLAERLFARLSELRADAEEVLRRDRKTAIHELQVYFSPIWHAQKQVTVLNRVIIAGQNDRIPNMYELEHAEEDAAARAEIDYLALTRSVEALHKFMLASRGATILVPVEVDTLENDGTWETYAKLLAAVPVSYRKMLALTIGSHEHVAASVLLRCADDLSNYVPYVAIELMLNDSRLDTIAAGAPWAISVNLTGMNASNGQLAADLSNFVRATLQPDIVSMAHGANSVGLVAAAVAARFTYIDGTAIHLPMFEPRPRRRLRSPVPADSMGHGMRLPVG